MCHDLVFLEKLRPLYVYFEGVFSVIHAFSAEDAAVSFVRHRDSLKGYSLARENESLKLTILEGDAYEQLCPVFGGGASREDLESLVERKGETFLVEGELKPEYYLHTVDN